MGSEAAGNLASWFRSEHVSDEPDRCSPSPADAIRSSASVQPLVSEGVERDGMGERR